MIHDLIFKPNPNQSPGAWPLIAEHEGDTLVFSQSLAPRDLTKDLIADKVRNIWDFIFLSIGSLGLFALLLHFVWLLDAIWLKIFLASLIVDLIFWTRIVRQNGKLTSDPNIDIKQLFSPDASQLLRRSLISRGSRQADTVHLFWQLLKDSKYRSLQNPSLRNLAQSLGAEDLADSPPAISSDFAALPYHAYVIAKELETKITSSVLMSALFEQPRDGGFSVHLSRYLAPEDEAVSVQEDTLAGNSPHNSISDIMDVLSRIKSNSPASKMRPIASILLVGVGYERTHQVASELADSEFGNKDFVIKVDLGEFNTPESVSRFLGERTYSSSFVSKFRERPFGVVLLKSVDGAHSEVQNILHELLDNGRIGDGLAPVLDFTNAIILATASKPYDKGDRFDAVLQAEADKKRPPLDGGRFLR